MGGKVESHTTSVLWPDGMRLLVRTGSFWFESCKTKHDHRSHLVCLTKPIDNDKEHTHFHMHNITHPKPLLSDTHRKNLVTLPDIKRQKFTIFTDTKDPFCITFLHILLCSKSYMDSYVVLSL